MVDNYTIYLVNQGVSKKVFWCFLERPQELVGNPGVFANSSASLAVRPNTPGINKFVIPAQYIVGAGASNNAVGLGVQVISSITADANLQDTWNALYATVPPNEGPDLQKSTTKSPANTLAIVTNKFDRANNEKNNWFSNQSFGVETDSGFMGMSWAPDPQDTTTLTPKLSFYISTGSFGSNTLADWTTVSNDAARISTPNDFLRNECTVTLTSSGDWVVTPGKPSALMLANEVDFASAENILSLMGAVALSKDLAAGDKAVDKLVSVKWDETADGFAAVGETFLTGTVTIATALGVSFAMFVLGGVNFDVTSNTQGQTRVRFSYRGNQSVEAIKSLFQAGRDLLFR